MMVNDGNIDVDIPLTYMYTNEFSVKFLIEHAWSDVVVLFINLMLYRADKEAEVPIEIYEGSPK